jgi:hypothetical protein
LILENVFHLLPIKKTFFYRTLNYICRGLEVRTPIIPFIHLKSGFSSHKATWPKKIYLWYSLILCKNKFCVYQLRSSSKFYPKQTSYPYSCSIPLTPSTHH